MDMGASVIARLKNKAKETGKPFQLHLQLFCQEEFLRRLAASCYAENLVLKGGLFIYTLTNFESRAMLPWDGRIGTFFGIGKDNRTPELIIQDELHLISGALGTVVGLYETAVDAICGQKGVYPR